MPTSSGYSEGNDDHYSMSQEHQKMVPTSKTTRRRDPEDHNVNLQCCEELRNSYPATRLQGNGQRYHSYRPWRPLRLRKVEAPTILRKTANRWRQVCKPTRTRLQRGNLKDHGINLHSCNW
jgi:hypothetical protein